MKLQPIVYTADPDAMVDWYATVLNKAPLYRSDMWTTFDFGGAYLAIHRVPEGQQPGRVQISLVAEDRLEAILSRLAEAGIEPEAGIKDEPFGRSFTVRDPDGSAIQVNENTQT